MSFIPTEEHLKAPGGWIKVDQPTELTLKVEAIKKEYANDKTVYKLELSDVESGDKMNESLWETEKAKWRICLFLQACSIQIAKGQEIALDDGSYVGKTLTAIVRMKEPNANGKQFAEIAEFGPGKYDSLWSAAPVKTPAPAADDELEKSMW